MNERRRSIFITGAASGIGKEAARHFAAAGWNIGLNDRDAVGLDALVAELGECASPYVADVCDYPAMQAALGGFCNSRGSLDVLFNCAGILDMRTFAETELSCLHAIVDVNVKGVINGIQAALPYLHQGSDARIITMSSLAAVYGVPEEAIYSASKFAVRGLTEALNIELEGEGIWVCDIMVGYVATPMVLDAEEKAKSVEIVGINVLPAQVAQTVWAAATGEQRVHWFVTDGDAAAARKFDETPWEGRRCIMKSTSGF